jgi:hypothetical protein
MQKTRLGWSRFVDDNCIGLDLQHQVVAFNDFAQAALAFAAEVAFNVYVVTLIVRVHCFLRNECYCASFQSGASIGDFSEQDCYFSEFHRAYV